MKILLTFPGQGTQTVGMLHHLPASALTTQLLSQASMVLNEDVLQLDSQQALQKTRAVQLCDLITGVVYARLLQAQGVSANMVSGLSIGAFPAAVIAGAITFDDAVKLVSLRGTLMEEAYPAGYGMTAIQGLFQEQVEDILQAVHSSHQPVYLANLNDERQFVISGCDVAMQKVATIAKDRGAASITHLAVSVPSHCPLLNQPAHLLYQAIKALSFRRPTIDYLSSSTARMITEPEDLAYDLAFNMCRAVHWFDSMVAARERGVRLAIEMPPGAVLTGLTKKAMIGNGEAVSIQQRSIKAVTELVKMLERTEG
ncbi:malonate decarboxylase epsilon subunit [Orbus hercynius]|uniref:Malonyl CoA-acyl carrier protein transacylase n=1 Tax=Orbus hercynius TaxID=593135 RepID=A0A495RAM8_9GAMM|nr:malonate decarboxylase subunit epsilon [Orbus hercynius]RKS84459.1 malonate decarboxylase epsilon subunit [Orbus hercynius]